MLCKQLKRNALHFYNEFNATRKVSIVLPLGFNIAFASFLSKAFAQKKIIEFKIELKLDKSLASKEARHHC